jgi:hypothetical protein
MTRAEHLAWAKTRALQYVDAGDTGGALDSLHSDLLKHPELEDHAGLMLGLMLAMGGHLSTPQQVREHIQGFNG